jgi:transposase
MSIQPQAGWPIPEETERVARAAFPNGNVYIRLRDELSEVYRDAQFAELFATRGQPAEAPGRLALITVMQFAEGLSDRQAADAVRSRIDWKYALGLELTDSGFHYSVLSEFRERLLEGQQEAELLDILLETLKQHGWLKARGRQRTDSTHVLAAVRAVNRLELVGETLRQALNELAIAAPEWLQGVAKPEWFLRYGRRFENMRLPQGQAEREQLAETIGADGATLLEAVRMAGEWEQLRQIRGVEVLRQVWVQQYWSERDEQGQEHIRLRDSNNQPPSEQRIQSPYDLEARYGAKRSTEWVGYKAYVTETCDEGSPHLITHVETTTAAVQDMDLSATIHAALEAKALLPNEHLMDAGFIDAELLVEAKRDLGVKVCGPVKKDVRWQANAGQGYGLADFTIDWEGQQAICPQGQRSSVWSEQRNAYEQEVIQVRFPKQACGPCPCRDLCTRSKRGVRSLVLRPQAQHEALQQNRKAQTTQEFWQRYAKRSGIEGTISQGVRAFDMRRARYVGLAKAALQTIAIVAAINLHRLFDWLEHMPLAPTRASRFVRLAPDPSLVPSGWRA